MTDRYYNYMGATIQQHSQNHAARMILTLLIAYASALSADTVKLRDGSILTGKMTSQDPSGITFESSGKSQYIAKRDIIAFREDNAGMEYFRKREEEESLANAENEKRQQEIADKLAPSYNGLWFGAGYGRAKLETFQESLLQSDRIISNGITGAGSASVYAPAKNHNAKGYSGYALFRRENYYIEASAYAYRSEAHFDQFGLPPISSIVQNSASETNQLGDFYMNPARRHGAAAVLAFQPLSFSPRWQVFFLGGITGEKTLVRVDSDIYTKAAQRFTPTFVLVANAYTRLRGFRAKLYGEGGVGGIDVRFRPGGGFELKLAAKFSSIEGAYKSRGNVATITSITLPTSTTVSGTYSHFREDAAMYERIADYSFTFFAPLGSRLRLFASAGTEFSHARIMHRVAMDYSQNTTVQSFFQSSYGQFLTKLYSRPEHTGRLSRVVVGVEARI
ncbi:MAG: hypothetical protein K8S54_15430 [Spirochaetia bacterium]|nr:hypothetical protein [Spirochaetia bacterium]